MLSRIEFCKPHIIHLLGSKCRGFTTNLAPVFNRLKSIESRGDSTGLFGISLLTDADGFHEFRSSAIHKSHLLVQEAVSDDRNRKIVQIFDELSNNLCKVADLAEFIRVAHPSIK